MSAVTELVVGLGSCGIAAGARQVHEALVAELAARGLNVPVSSTGCIGACHREPLVEVRTVGGRFLYGDLDAGKVKKLVRPCCHICEDFTGEYADVSVGNVGTPDGWSTVIVRTEAGEKAFRAAVDSGLLEAQPVEGFDLGDTLVHRLARMKREKGSDE